MIKSWRHKKERGGSLSALALITLFFILLFVPVILGGKFFVLYDASSYSYPLRTVAWGALLQGRLPLWTPLIMSGYPLFSMSHLGFAYPLTWGYLFLPGYVAEEIYVLAPFLLTPVFMYCYARQLRRSRAASLLAALAFGYGGMFIIGYVPNGMLANSTMWLPLVLLCLERSRRRSFVSSLLCLTAAYAMSVLTGVGQGFLLVGIVSVAYAIFLSLAQPVEAEDDEEDEKLSRPSLWSLKRWRPLLLMLISILLSAGVAAFQILETARAVRRSIRSTLEYGVFSGNSFNLSMSWKSLLAPLSPAVFPFDTSAYVAPLVLVLAVAALAQALRKRLSDARIFFWAGTATVAWLLMLGEFLPFYRALHFIPLLNLFRAPARHAFEWTFALSILSAYGWDAASNRLAQRRTGEAATLRRPHMILVALATLTLLAAVCWWQQAGSLIASFFETPYLCWKAIFTMLLLVSMWLGWRVATASRWSARLLVAMMALGCFVEPCIIITKWWWPLAKTADRFTTPSPVTRLLQGFPPEQNRVYTRAGPFEMEYALRPPLDPPNLTALYGLQNVAGYEPLILERYSRALGNVGFDTIGTRWGYAPDNTLFHARSHVLDLLNNRFIALYGRPFLPGQYVEKEGIRFKGSDEELGVKPGEKRTLLSIGATGDTLALVTTLSYGGELADGEPVARLRIYARDGRVVEAVLRAGADTAEWAHERADVRAHVRHRLAAVFDSAPGDAANSFSSHRYWSRTALGAATGVERVEIENVTRRAQLAVWKATVYDSATSMSLPLESFAGKDEDFDSERWKTIYHEQGVRLFRNERAQPRVWLVSEAEAVDGQEALQRIQGKSERDFNPRRVALLEVAARELPQLDAHADLTNASARLIAYEENRLVIETDAAAPAVLVTSEINYPGWVATMDGQPALIHNTDFLLRGVALPTGHHLVEMRYTAPAVRAGAWVSLCALLVIGGLVVYELLRRRVMVKGTPSKSTSSV